MVFHLNDSTLTGACILGLTLLTPLSASAQPAHLTWALDVAENVTPELNEYGSNPSYVNWPGVGASTTYANRSLCSTFVTVVMGQAYGFNSTYMKAWLGTTSPTATIYHDAIVAEDGFDHVPTLFDIEPGDFLAVKYPAGGSVSGHIATVVSDPVLRVSTNPLVVGTFQYEVEIVDSSSTGHGFTDTRLMPNGSWDAGAGVGIMRLYVDGLGNIVGHTWSIANGTFYGQAVRHMVIGRLL
jgi:hypothetical protein